MTGCAQPPSDPKQRHIILCSSCDSWQQQLGSTKDKLTAQEQLLIEHYVQRVHYLSPEPSSQTRKIINGAAKKYNVGKDISETPHEFLVGKALKDQLEYERLHPFNPTGKPLTLAERYPVAVVSTPPINPAALSPDSEQANKTPGSSSNLSSTAQKDSYLLPQRWQLSLLNLGQGAIRTFEGSLILQSQSSGAASAAIPASAKTKPLVITIPLTQFVPPIPENQSGRFIVDVPPSFVSKLTTTQLENPKKIKLIIKSGKIVLEGGDAVVVD